MPQLATEITELLLLGLLLLGMSAESACWTIARPCGSFHPALPPAATLPPRCCREPRLAFKLADSQKEGLMEGAGKVRLATIDHRSLARITRACAQNAAEVDDRSSQEEDDDFSAKSAFLEWAAQQGIRAPKIQLAKFPPSGYRGVVATENIAAGEPLVVLPRSSALFVGNKQPTPFPEFVGAAFWNQQSLHVRLALVLLHESHRAVRGRSPFAGWLEMLPDAHHDKPCRWGEGELDQLRDPLLAAEIEEQRAVIDTIHRQLLASGGGLVSGEEVLAVSQEEFRWAMDTVISRTFGAHIPATAAPGVWQTVALVILSQLSRRVPRLRRLGPTWWRRLCDGTATSSEVLLIEPLVDMFNHRTDALCDTSYELETDTITLKSLGAEWRAGQQIFICYGCKDNRALLKAYGFVEVDNPADTRVVTGSLSAARTLLQPLLCGGAGGSALERETACNTSEAFECAWRARVELLSQCGVLSDVASMRMTAAGPSARAAAGLRMLLSDSSEFLRLQGMHASLRLGAAAEVVSLDTEKRVLECVLVVSRQTIATAATATAATDTAAVSSLSSSDTPVTPPCSSSMARLYREEQLKLLLCAVGNLETRARLSRQLGTAVATAEDGWLEHQQHDLLRQMNNLGF